MAKTNFDLYLEELLKDPEFRRGFEEAGRDIDVAFQLYDLREAAGYSQTELAKLVGTTQQQISRIESTAYTGHSLSMLRRVARALNAEVIVTIRPIVEKKSVAKKAKSSKKSAKSTTGAGAVREDSAKYGAKRTSKTGNVKTKSKPKK